MSMTVSAVEVKYFGAVWYETCKLFVNSKLKSKEKNKRRPITTSFVALDSGHLNTMSCLEHDCKPDNLQRFHFALLCFFCSRSQLLSFF